MKVLSTIAVLIISTIVGVIYCSELFVAVLDEAGWDPFWGRLSLILAQMMGVISLVVSSFFVVNRWNERRLFALGGLVLSTGFSLCAWSLHTDIGALLVSGSGLVGSGLGAVVILPMIHLIRCFRERTGLCIGATIATGMVGSLIQFEFIWVDGLFQEGTWAAERAFWIMGGLSFMLFLLSFLVVPVQGISGKTVGEIIHDKSHASVQVQRIAGKKWAIAVFFLVAVNAIGYEGYSLLTDFSNKELIRKMTDNWTAGNYNTYFVPLFSSVLIFAIGYFYDKIIDAMLLSVLSLYILLILVLTRFFEFEMDTIYLLLFSNGVFLYGCFQLLLMVLVVGLFGLERMPRGISIAVLLGGIVSNGIALFPLGEENLQEIWIVTIGCFSVILLAGLLLHRGKVLQ